ncbi:MAG TPA: helix-turn-helix domain-containing protein [Rhodocyclaceae bacterium]|nr:helix-turn-helix domain-containing protein [Rhodocyclaceae bacterium]
MIPATVGSPPGNGEGGANCELGRPQFNTTTPAFSYPAPASVKGHTLADLLAGDKLTHMDVWERHGSSRAAHHVLRLRQAGWPIRTMEVDAKTSDGRVAHIAEYSLPSETIEAAGERGQAFIAEARAARRAS